VSRTCTTTCCDSASAATNNEAPSRSVAYGVVQQVLHHLLQAHRIHLRGRQVWRDLSHQLHTVPFPHERGGRFDHALHEFTDSHWRHMHLESPGFGTCQCKQVIDERLELHRLTFHHRQIMLECLGR